jgi:putative ABC transport system substrate-binding protein
MAAFCFAPDHGGRIDLATELGQFTEFKNCLAALGTKAMTEAFGGAMRRREFIPLIGGAVAAWPFATRAQPAMAVVGFLSGRSLASDAHLVAAFRQGLNETGYVEDRNVKIEFHWAEGQFDRLRVMAADLVGRRVAAIFAGGMDAAIRDVRTVITTVPTVFATGGDPVGLGLVASFSRPGGNATAVTVITAELMPKRLELLRELVASAMFVAVLVNPNDANAASYATDAEVAARTLGIQIRVVHAGTEADFDTAFATLLKAGANALLVPVNSLFITSREKLLTLAARHAVPAIYDRREFPAAGGLMSYGASITEQYRQGGVYIGKILGGVKPADLPVLQPTRFELAINLKTARALGLTVPPMMLARADELIE